MDGHSHLFQDIAGRPGLLSHHPDWSYAFVASGEVFAMRCRRHAELLRKIAKTARTGELRESLLRLAQEFDQMAERAIEPMSMSLPERSKKTAN